jgi:hypothetical protein
VKVYSLAFFKHAASGYESPKAGTSQGTFFDGFIPSVVRAFRAAWAPEWELWIHTDLRVQELPSFAFLKKCYSAGMLHIMPSGEAQTLCGSMLWRVDPILRCDRVDWVVCRDVDSLPMHRDRKMVEEAIANRAVAHAILDSESHSGPLMGGMTAWSVECAPLFAKANRVGIDFNRHGSDQQFLNRELWPLVKGRTLIHQRRRDIQYPEAMKTLLVVPQETELDKVVRHIGAGYDREKAVEVCKRLYPDPELDAIEESLKVKA